MPGVDSAASIQLLPYDNWGWNFNVRYEGQPGDNPTQMPIVENRIISPGFFGVTKQRLIAGRALRQSDDDRPESPFVVVVNQALVDLRLHGTTRPGSATTLVTPPSTIVTAVEEYP